MAPSGHCDGGIGTKLFLTFQNLIHNFLVSTKKGKGPAFYIDTTQDITNEFHLPMLLVSSLA